MVRTDLQSYSYGAGNASVVPGSHDSIRRVFPAHVRFCTLRPRCSWCPRCACRRSPRAWFDKIVMNISTRPRLRLENPLPQFQQLSASDTVETW